MALTWTTTLANSTGSPQSLVDSTDIGMVQELVKNHNIVIESAELGGCVVDEEGVPQNDDCPLSLSNTVAPMRIYGVDAYQNIGVANVLQSMTIQTRLLSEDERILARASLVELQRYYGNQLVSEGGRYTVTAADVASGGDYVTAYSEGNRLGFGVRLVASPFTFKTVDELFADGGIDNGFRRAQSYDPAVNDWTDYSDDMYSYGPIENGDIIGPWIVQDLRDMMDAIISFTPPDVYVVLYENEG